MPNWTEEQQQAIITRGSNLLVAAAAGSGKTAVLVERIIRIISDEEKPIDVDRLLVVTFTNAAASEMKERVGIAIRGALKKNPLSRHLYRQSTLLNKASIMTLHSFCLEIVRENFYQLGIDPNFRIADETEGELLRWDVLEELLEDYYVSSEEEDEFTKLIDAYGGERDDILIKELIFKLYDFSRSNPWPKLWLKEVVENFAITNWFEGLLDNLQMELSGVRSLLVQAYNLASIPGGPIPYLNNLSQEIASLDDLLALTQVSWEKLYEAFPQMSFQRLPSIKKDSGVNPEIQERVKEFRDKAKGKIKDLENKYFCRSPQELVEDLENLKPHLNMLKQLVEDFSGKYQKAKLKRNLVDFNDLEHFCLQVLLSQNSTPEELQSSLVCQKIQEKFFEVLIDEYQDINEVQETILKLVTKNNNMFMVGDVKQSIYRFRLAKPELFLHKYQSFSSEKNSLNRRIDLAKNFRCRQEIVNGVNFIFQQIMTPQVGELSYDEKARLIYGANYPEYVESSVLENQVELHLLEKKIIEDLEEDNTPLEREAYVIGKRIKDLFTENYVVFDKTIQGYRPLAYRDIVILLRSPKGMAEVFMEYFRKMGIPVYAELGSGYFKATEVQTLLALLKIIDNPRQDIPLVAVLRSPIVGLSAEELTEIRLQLKQESFYEALIKTAQSNENDLGEKVIEFLKQLATWRTLARQGNLADLIWTLYRETGYFDYVGAMPGGSQRQANLRALHDRARQYETTSFRGLFTFLRFLERLAENNSDLEPAKALSENENVVRIMSIHKSKGLEFPVVFVAGLGKQFNMLDTRQDVIIHKELGLGPVFIDPEKRIKYPTIAKLAIETKIKQETLAEEMRILYVALTRAREKLILVGSAQNLSKKIANWCEFSRDDELPQSELAQAKCYLDWLGPAFIRHEDSKVLWELVGLDREGPGFCDPSKWQVSVYQEGLFLERDSKVAATKEMLEYIKELQPIQVNPYLQEKIAQRLNWHYPHENLVNKGAKVTVSEIKNKFRALTLEDEVYRPHYEFSKRPVFLQRHHGLSAQEKGSALHLVMQHIDLNKTPTLEYLEQFLYSLVKRKLLTAEQKDIIDLKMINNFFSSPLGKRLLKATLVKREIAFSMALKAPEIYPDIEDPEEKVFLQGVIDCLWWENDGWILLDYKSDQVNPEGISEIIKRYEIQINLYTKAVETILKQPIKERYLYLFNLGEEVKV